MDLMYFLTCLSLLLQNALPHDFHQAYRDTFNPATPWDEWLTSALLSIANDCSLADRRCDHSEVLSGCYTHCTTMSGCPETPQEFQPTRLCGVAYSFLWELDLQLPTPFVHILNAG
jgi:hypothetical protein